MHTNLFCRHGWVVEDSSRDMSKDPRKMDVKAVEPSDDSVVDRLWNEEIIQVSPFIVICTIGSIGAFLMPDGEALSHARFFSTLGRARHFCREFPLDQRNFFVDLRPDTNKATVTRPDPLPTPNDLEDRPYLVLDAYLDQWGRSTLRWFSSEDEVFDEFYGLSGVTSGCLLRCAFCVDEDEPQTPLVAAWLYAVGRSDRMRWSLHPWPPVLPPPYIAAKK